jgi:fructosamine-3-kinase
VNSFNQDLENLISDATGQPFSLADKSGVGGGCIHVTSVIRGVDGRSFFLKQNSADHLSGFIAEAHGLEVMAKTGTIRVPHPIGFMESGRQAFLVMEHLSMGGRQGDWEAMGRQFAMMHRHTGASFGWDADNFIGSSPQLNEWKDDWIDFYRECRLQPQMSWARRRGLGLTQGDALLECLPEFFESYLPEPSLLHGDLWAGNASFLQDGSPVIFDPAAYYGDREADMAMTEMFGGFNSGFYEAYNREWPLDPGYRIRKSLYILYHELNHYNLFGGGYGHQAESTISRLLNSLR